LLKVIKNLIYLFLNINTRAELIKEFFGAINLILKQVLINMFTELIMDTSIIRSTKLVYLVI